MKRLLVALALTLMPGIAEAANCSSYPFTLTNGTTADANQVMSNFNNILTCANSNLAHNGANSDITSLSALSTPLSVSQGGTGLATLTTGGIPVGNGISVPTFLTPGASTGNIILNDGGVWTVGEVTSGTYPLKTSPLTQDTLALYDSAAGGILKNATIGTVLNTRPLIMVEDRQSSGVNGSSLTQNTYTDRPLQTIVIDTNSLATVSTPNITLPPGTYDMDGDFVANSTAGASTCETRAFLTSAVSVLTDIGGNHVVSSTEGTAGGTSAGMHMAIKTRFVFTNPGQLKFQTYCTGATVSVGAATSSGEAEVYSMIRFYKVL